MAMAETPAAAIVTISRAVRGVSRQNAMTGNVARQRRSRRTAGAMGLPSTSHNSVITATTFGVLVTDATSSSTREHAVTSPDCTAASWICPAARSSAANPMMIRALMIACLR
jgi:hypothetical protein